MSMYQFTVAFVLGVILSCLPSISRANQCSDLFQTGFSESLQNPRDFFFEVAKFETPMEFAKALRAEEKPIENPLFDLLVAPAVWNIARLTIQENAVVERGVTDWISKIQKQAMDEIRSRDTAARLNSRPRVMTGDERKLVIASGSYSSIEGTSLPATKAQRDREAFRGMLEQAQAAYERKNRNESLETFRRLVKSAGGEILISKLMVRTILRDPVEFAIAYAGMHGLTYRAGDAGMTLSPFVPWGGRTDMATANSLRALASMARASISDPEVLRSADNLALEILRREFASDLNVVLEVDGVR